MSSTASVLASTPEIATFAKFGRGRLADFSGDMVIYRNLEPVDRRLPGLRNAYFDMELRTDRIPRKQDPDYAKAATWFLRKIQELRRARQPLTEMIFLGDTLFNDGQAYRNIAAFSRLRGACFIGAERSEQEATFALDEAGVYTANRWQMLADWATMLREQGFALDQRTAVIIDIDKTALGAKGRNDKVIDRARLTGIFRTMDSVLGDKFDRVAFEEHYSELNRSRYHQFTADNQDYLAYICLVLNTNLISFDEVIQEANTNSLDNFEQFIRWVNSRMMINPEVGEPLRETHEAVLSSVQSGDPTPFKRFRRQEFLSTLEYMGNLDDDATASELLTGEITITEEVYELAMWLKARDCAILCLSDKPDEASTPDRRSAGNILPLHRAETHRVGGSIQALLDRL
ncbi:MAG: hypothetical protein KAX65_03935 [Caldilineaceae bacterium]|nr:hypothetical protein [Caldilineaceae bacterium]